MSEQTKSNQTGFTIIELMIVLAVGGLILTIIFFAVPALQRSSRNNQRKQDVTAVLGAVSQYELNHSGTFPSVSADFTAVLNNSKISYYDKTSIAITAIDSGDAVGTNNTGNDTINIRNRSKCSDTGGQPTGQGAGYSDIVALYSIETTSGSAPKCQEL